MGREKEASGNPEKEYGTRISTGSFGYQDTGHGRFQGSYGDDRESLDRTFQSS